MKIAALTMVYRDYEMLARWCDYYGDMLGRENLFIVSHGADPRHREIAQGCNCITVPREPVANFDTWRFEMLHRFVQFLSSSYEWVIRTDSDEFIVADRAYGTVPEILQRQDVPFAFALGLEVFQHESEKELTPDPITAQRRYGLVLARYSKAFAVRNGMRLENHGVHINPRGSSSYTVNMPEGLYLLHMRMCSNAVHQAHRDRKIMMKNAPRSWKNLDKWERIILDHIALGQVDDSDAHLSHVRNVQSNRHRPAWYRRGILVPVATPDMNRVVELPQGILGQV
ncbi:glycosyltransferase family 2 protein [Ruegeria atlantica]|uniref:glycosyltransferase family 2 protein n=1 Tax=Ruegeria atlantica TaxID=81569 RepID=UPI00147B2075|nr:glycosyltransferase family 2 protein [Ruegeria atlantica]